MILNLIHPHFLIPALQLLIVGYFAQKDISVIGVVHAAAIVVEAVAHDEIVDMEQHVVDRNLVENLLLDGDGRGFILDYHTRPERTVVKDAVAAQPLASRTQLNLVGQQRRRIAFVADEKVDEMLADPLFGRQGDIFAAQHVEDGAPAGLFADSYVISWKVQLIHVTNVFSPYYIYVPFRDDVRDDIAAMSLPFCRDVFNVFRRPDVPAAAKRT